MKKILTNRGHCESFSIQQELELIQFEILLKQIDMKNLKEEIRKKEEDVDINNTISTIGTISQLFYEADIIKKKIVLLKAKEESIKLLEEAEEEDMKEVSTSKIGMSMDEFLDKLIKDFKPNEEIVLGLEKVEEEDAALKLMEKIRKKEEEKDMKEISTSKMGMSRDEFINMIMDNKKL